MRRGFEVVAWCLGIPGLVLSYYTGVAYIPQIRAGIAQHRARRAPVLYRRPLEQGYGCAMNIPDDLRYSTDHEWVAARRQSMVTIGITDFAQDCAWATSSTSSCPRSERAVAVGDSFSEVETTKSVVEMYAPVSGSIVAINAALDDKPELLNERSLRRRVDLRASRCPTRRVRCPARRRRLPRSHRRLTRTMCEYMFCNQCGHRNPPTATFCSSCGSPLDSLDDRTITLTVVDPLQDAPGTEDDLVVPIGELPTEVGVLIVRAGAQAGDRFALDAISSPGSVAIPTARSASTTSPCRAATPRSQRTADGYIVSDSGSLNGTYVNQERIERAMLHHGDELQIGKFRLVFFERSDG